MSEHFDNCWDMTAEEAEAVQASMDRRNPPKIPVRPCPTKNVQQPVNPVAPPAGTVRLVRSTVYRVHLQTRANVTMELLFSFTPSLAYIESALCQLEESVPHPYDKGDEEQHDKDIARLENLIALVRLVPVLHVPKPGKHEDHQLKVAGVDIGHVGIKAMESWDFAEGP